MAGDRDIAVRARDRSPFNAFLHLLEEIREGLLWEGLIQDGYRLVLAVLQGFVVGLEVLLSCLEMLECFWIIGCEVFCHAVLLGKIGVALEGETHGLILEDHRVFEF